MRLSQRSNRGEPASSDGPRWLHEWSKNGSGLNARRNLFHPAVVAGTLTGFYMSYKRIVRRGQSKSVNLLRSASLAGLPMILCSGGAFLSPVLYRID